MSDFNDSGNRPRSRSSLRGAVIDAPEIPEVKDSAGGVSPRKRTLGLSTYARVWVAAGIVTIIAIALIFNLYHWQVERGTDLAKRATEQHLKTIDIPARRGLIYDANGMLLASNSQVYIVWGAPRGLTEKQSTEATDKLSRILPDVSRDKIKSALTLNDKRDNLWNLITGDVNADTAEKIRQADIDGISLEAKPRRVYPNGTLMGQLLGFVNHEMKPAYGVESYYDKILSGQPGKMLAEVDAIGNPISLNAPQISEPVDGGNLTLTLDAAIQQKVEKEVLAAMFQYNATGATGLVMNPQTGAILAWVSYPDYDPNEFNKTASARFDDPVISKIYEPGSTFKIFTAAIGIDTGAVTPDSAADLPGCVIKYGWTVCNYNKVGYQHQTVTLTLQKSSNVGAMWIVEKYGPQKYYPYMKNFGFGQNTGIDVWGEVPGIVRTPDTQGWSMLDLDMNAFGQAVSVTPLQLITGVSAVANGGKLMKPYVVQKITRDGKVIQETKPTEVRQVISPESAKITTEMLVQAVKGGETRLADVKGYRIAGKNGTAQFPMPGGGYNPNLYIGSTIAYAPADNPQFVVLVKLDSINTFGSNTAAPAVKNIIEFLLHYYDIPPTEPVVDNTKH